MFSLAIGALMLAVDPVAAAANELSSFLGRPVASIVKHELGKVRYASNEQGYVTVVADRKLFLISAKVGLASLPLRVPAGASGFAYVRVSPDRQWAAFGDGQEKVALGSEKRLISLAGVGSAYFDGQSTLVAVPSLERPLIPPSGTIAGIPIRMSPQPSLWTPEVSLTSSDSPEGLELAVKQGEGSAKCSTGPGFRPERPNIGFSPLGKGSGLVTRSSGSADLVDFFLVTDPIRAMPGSRGVFGAWSAFAGIVFQMGPKGESLLDPASGKTVAWKSNWRPVWIPGTDSALLYELGGENSATVIFTFAK